MSLKMDEKVEIVFDLLRGRMGEKGMALEVKEIHAAVFEPEKGALARLTKLEESARVYMQDKTIVKTHWKTFVFLGTCGAWIYTTFFKKP